MDTLLALDLFGIVILHGLAVGRRRGRHIADGGKLGLAGLEPLIGLDMSPVDFHLRAVDADIFNVANDTNGEDDAVDRDFLTAPPAQPSL